MTTESVMISLRIHKDLLDKIDKLEDVFAQDAHLSPSGLTSRADIIRHLLLEGVERFHDVKQAKKSKRSAT